jgi:hypothetical protein
VEICVVTPYITVKKQKIGTKCDREVMSITLVIPIAIPTPNKVEAVNCDTALP